jgi:hypothetical protein
LPAFGGGTQPFSLSRKKRESGLTFQAREEAARGRRAHVQFGCSRDQTAALHDVEKQTERVYVHAILQDLQ